MATQNPSSTMQTTTHTSQPVMVVNQATTLGRGDLNSFKKVRLFLKCIPTGAPLASTCTLPCTDL